jgi:hypothetical protein
MYRLTAGAMSDSELWSDLRKSVEAIASCINSAIVPALLAATAPPPPYLPPHLKVSEACMAPHLLSLLQRCDSTLQTHTQRQHGPRNQLLHLRLQYLHHQYSCQEWSRLQHDILDLVGANRQLQAGIHVCEMEVQGLPRHKKQQAAKVKAMKASSKHTACTTCPSNKSCCMTT